MCTGLISSISIARGARLWVLAVACVLASCGFLAVALLTSTAAPSPPPNSRSSQQLDVQLDTAYELILRSQFETARAILEPLGDADPASGKTAFMLGLSHHQQRHYKLALPHFQRAVELEPDYHQTQHFLGYCLYYLGDGEGARRAFETFLDHSPNNPHTHFALGLVAYDEDRLEEAEACFIRAIELCQGDRALRQRRASARARLADVYIRERKLELARQQLESAIRLAPTLYGAHFKLSRVLTNLGEHEAARLAYRRFLHAREKSRAGRR